MKTSLLLLPLLSCCGAVARADLSYTQVTSTPFGAMMGGGGSGITTKVYAKGDSSRTEAQMFGRKTITISRGARQVIQIDPATKTYTSSNAGSMGLARNMMPSGQKPPAMNMTISTQKLGTTTIRGIKTPHYRVNMDMKIGTPRGAQNMKMTMEVWGSNVQVPISAKTRSDVMANLPANFKTMFGGGGIKGDVKGMSQAFSTVPLRMKILMNGAAISTTETTSIATKPLSTALFAVPAGYRAVSNAQFSQMQQAAMRKTMSGMMKNMPRR